MDGPHDQTLYWGWIPILDPDLEIVFPIRIDTATGVEQLSDDTFRAWNKTKTGSTEPLTPKEIMEKAEGRMHATVFHVSAVDNFIVLQVLSVEGDIAHQTKQAQAVYDLIKAAYHNDGCHSFGKGLRIVRADDEKGAVDNTFEQLNRKSYYDDAAGDFNMIVDTNYHLSYVAHTEYMIPFLQRYRRFFDPFFVELMTDKAKTRLIQAKRYLETYTAIESVRMENSSRKMSMAALLVSMFSMIVAIGALFDDVWVTATMVALAVGIMLGMLSDIHGIIRKKLTRNPVRKNDGKG